MKLKILPKILLPVILVLLISLTVLTLVPLTSFQKVINKDLDTQIKNIAVGAVDNFNDMIEITSYQASWLANNNQLINAFKSADYEGAVSFAVSQKAPQTADAILILDKDANVLANSAEASFNAQNLSQLDAIQKGIQGDGYTQIGELLDLPYAMYSASPIIDPVSSETIGAVICAFRLALPSYVDEYKEKYGVECTIFKEDTRISTTVLNEKKERAVGTKASDPVIKSVLNEGKDFSSRIQLFGNPFLVYYTPIKNGLGQNTGMFFIGISTEETDKTISSMRLLGIGIAVVALVIIAAILLFIVKGIVSRMGKLAITAKLIAVGDLTSKVQRDDSDELGDLADAFNEMQIGIENQVGLIQNLENGDLTTSFIQRSANDNMSSALQKLVSMLNSTFLKINSTAIEVAQNAKNVSESSINLAQGATEQTETVKALVTSIKRISEKTGASADKASNAAKLAETIKQNAEVGSKQMGEMMMAVKQINDASASINKVIKVIDDIAFQTNILALNAAVEAARAGQHGKGFAVVAEEVRNLAAKSADAAKETGALIANSIEKAELGAKIASSTSESLADIVIGINESSKIVNDIADSSIEQRNAIDEISRGVAEVGSVVGLISEGAELSSEAATSMNVQSDNLYEFVSNFKLNENNSARHSDNVKALPYRNH